MARRILFAWNATLALDRSLPADPIRRLLSRARAAARASACYAGQRSPQGGQSSRHSPARRLTITARPSRITSGHLNATRLPRPARLSPLLRGRRRGPVPLLRARAWRQSPELVAAGAAFPRPLHLRDLRASRLCAVERAAGRPRSRRLRGRPRRAHRSSRRARRASRGAIDGRLDRARVCACAAGSRARAGACLHRRDDRAGPVAVRRSRISCPRGSASRGSGGQRQPGEQHPRRGRRAAGTRATGCTLPLPGDRCAERRRQGGPARDGCTRR